MAKLRKKIVADTPAWDVDRLGIDNADSYEELISQLYEIRTRRNLKQQDIADKMGTSKSAVSRLEAGNGNPTIRTLLDYAEAAGAYLALIAVPSHNTAEWKERARQVTADLQDSFFCEVTDAAKKTPGKSVRRSETIAPTRWSSKPADAGV